jgi:3-deoxy-manno-octulosonate cytidylyltransferase (CMP-KDO synthetase)
LNKFDPGGFYKTIINLQGDLPTIRPEEIQTVMLPLENQAVDIATLACQITNPVERDNPHIVKIATSFWQSVQGGETARAIYFSRQAIPANAEEFYHHIGIYAYRRQALEHYVRFPVSYLEKTEKLEQLRALEQGMRIDVAKLTRTPPSVDTFEDLETIQRFFLPS